MLPSGSVEPEASTETASLLTDELKDAVGATLGTLPPPLAKWSVTSPADSTRP